MYWIFAIALLALNLVAATATYAQHSNADSAVVLTFLSHRSGYNQIYASEPDGSNSRPFFGGPITDIPSFDDSYTMFREPHWTRQSTNGKYFASWVYETGKPYSEFQGALRPMLCVGSIDGTWTQIVNPDCGEEFAWSPNSRQLAFSILSTHHYRGALQNRPTTTEICFSGVDGSDFTCVLEQEGMWFVLDWSPDGDRLLVERRTFGKKLEDATSGLFEFRLTDAVDARNRAQLTQNGMSSERPSFLT